MKDLMIDLETMGKTPDGVIVAIGAIPFDLFSGATGDPFYVKVDPDSCVEAGLTIDPDTVAWWERQSPEARAEWQGTPESPAYPLREALRMFLGCYRHPELKPWGNGATFDITILESAHAAVGMRPPWNYRQPRDMRTLIDVAERKMGGKLKAKQPAHTKHKAIEDCRFQIAKCVAAMRILCR